MNKELIASLAWAGGIIALALGATVARQLGYIDGDTVTRVVIGVNGLMIAWYGNSLSMSFSVRPPGLGVVTRMSSTSRSVRTLANASSSVAMPFIGASALAIAMIRPGTRG